MAPSAPRRKLQDPVLLDALEAALGAGEPLNVALVRLGVSSSTLKREMLRDDGLRRRLENALRGGSPVLQTSDSPEPIVGERQAALDPEEPTRPEASRPARDLIDNIAPGTGRVVFGVRRPQPLATVRRVALRSAPSWTSESAARGDDRVAPQDWLPALFVMALEGAAAITVSGLPVIGAFILLGASAYGSAMYLRSRAMPTKEVSGFRVADLAGAPRQQASPPFTPAPGSVRTDLAWLSQTIGKPEPGARPPARRKRNDRGG